ncbi:MAG: electron transporter, partial [Enterococcus faecalis]|nr:electron transporter [Enterococcus faecalis]
LDKGPGLVKGWTYVRDLPRPPKSSENFRSWFKKHQEGEKND